MFIILELASNQGSILVPLQGLECVEDVTAELQEEHGTDALSIAHVRLSESVMGIGADTGVSSKPFFLKGTAASVFLMIRKLQTATREIDLSGRPPRAV